MKNYFPEGYCPQREKVLDLSRSVLTGNRRFARCRRHYGRYRAKVDRQMSRELLAGVVKLSCLCNGDVDVDCPRCQADELPTVSQTRQGNGIPQKPSSFSPFEGFADDLGQLFRWYHDRTDGLELDDVEAFLRAMFLSSPFGHSVKTRHAYDHLFWDVERRRKYSVTGGS